MGAGVERRVVAGGAKGQLMHLGFAQNDGAGIAQFLYGLCVLGRDITGKGWRRRAALQAGGVQVVFNHHRNAAQRAANTAGNTVRIGLAGRRQCLLPVQGNKQVKVVALFNTLETGFHQLDAAQPAFTKCISGLGDGQIGHQRQFGGFKNPHATLLVSGQRPGLSRFRALETLFCCVTGPAPATARTVCRQSRRG